MAYQSQDIIRRSATNEFHPRASGAGPPAGGGEAYRRHHLYRLQSLSGGLLRMERYS